MYKLKSKLLFLIIILISSKNFAQKNTAHNQDDFVSTISKTTADIKIDGDLSESIWSTLPATSDFWMKFPTNETKAAKKTEVKLTYNDKFLYVGVTCYDSDKKYLVQSLKRDKGLRNGDGFAILLDPYNQKANGFIFGTSVYNSQSEDVLNGADGDVTFSWDNTWYSQTKIYDDRWTAEFAIPFNILRFDAAKKTWGVNFIRSDRKQNHFHTWTKIPLNFRGTDMGYFGKLNWDAAPPKSNSKLSLNPYISSGLNKDKILNTGTNFTGNAGLDAKVAVTPSINLDLTVNPDFSNVDVDKQVTNLSRFSIFFPERRAFFLENDDLFSSYGTPPIRPFYSRRIGSSNGIAVPILFGARLSGNLSKDTRFGLMNIQTGKKNGEAPANFTAASVQKRLFARSSIKAYVLNKETFLTAAQKIAKPTEGFARNAGTELNYSSKSGKWSAWYGHHFSLKPTITGKNQYINTGTSLSTKTFSAVVNFNIIGTNYYTDMGFTRRISNYDAILDTTTRNGFKSIFNELKYNYFYPKNSKLNKFEVRTNITSAFTENYKFNEFYFENTYQLDFKNSANLALKLNYFNEELLYASKFINKPAALPIPKGKYVYSQISLKANSDIRKNLSVESEFIFGKYYTADFRKANVTINVRKQPKLNMALNMEYNELKFPGLYGSDKLFLIAPVVEYNFSTKLFWTTFFQYNTQVNNFNINSRIQYRYKPMSDLFIVYTDNYYTSPFLQGKNRAIVLKLNYWINM